MEFVQIPVLKREGLGSHKSSSLRRSGKVPGVLYGLKKPTLSLTLEEADLAKFLRSGNRLVVRKHFDLHGRCLFPEIIAVRPLL